MTRSTSYASLPHWLALYASECWLRCRNSLNEICIRKPWLAGSTLKYWMHFCTFLQTHNQSESIVAAMIETARQKNVYISSAVQMSIWSWKISICLLWLHFLETFAVCALLEMVDDLENKTIEDGGITVDFWIVEVQTSIWNYLCIFEHLWNIKYFWIVKRDTAIQNN